jgi:hypothetical protein
VQLKHLKFRICAYNGGLQVAKKCGLITETERLARTITLVAGANGLVMIDEYNKSSALRLPSYRQATASDYIVLASGGKCSSVLPLGNGTQFPLADMGLV